MIERNLLQPLHKMAEQYPVVTITGPRQSGKTTLVRYAFPQKPYCSLESIDIREFAKTDPRGFLSQYPEGAIFDEIQNVPDLFSYLQEIVDEKKQMGQFILTGSQNFSITSSVSQSLAGRTAMLHLLPLCFSEISLSATHLPIWETIWKGGYPRVYNNGIDTQVWLKNYITTYLERDIRQLINIQDLHLFSTFLQLIASHTGQELNYSRIAGDVGVSSNTIKGWTSVLMASFLGFSLPAYSPNIRKQIVKHPKFHFFDTGLVCALLGISSPLELSKHSLRGFIFETWIIAEVYKEFFNRGEFPRCFHYRENRGREFDLLIQKGLEYIPCEIKSAQTITHDFFKHFTHDILNVSKKGILFYGGDFEQNRSIAKIIPWNKVFTFQDE